MPIFTVSSQFGAGGPAVAKQLAERLGIEYLDKEIIHQIALDLDVPEEKVEEYDEAQYNRVRSLLSNLFDFDALKRNAKLAGEEEPPQQYDDREEIPFHYEVKGWIDRDIYKQMMIRVLTGMGRKGSGVIKGRGSQCILQDSPKAIHVRFVAGKEDRIARTMQRRGLTRGEAVEMIERMDKRGADYVATYFDCDITDPSLYHVVFNTSKVPYDECLDLLEKLAKDLFPG